VGHALPDNPAAWLMTAARHRAIDRLRRRALLGDKHRELEYELRSSGSNTDPQTLSDDDFGDDLLRLMFTACHPVLAPDARVALVLMEIQASRLRARVDAAGAPVLLPDQDRARWDHLLIHRGLAALERAARLNGARLRPLPARAKFSE
jgi:predicted RNA polymerase sigma factor